MIKKFKLENEELEFKIINKTIFDIDAKYDNFGDVINGLMYGKNLYNNAIKVLSCSCLTREIEPNEFIEKLTSKQITQEIVPFATGLYLDYMGVKESNEPQDHKKSDKKK